MKCKESTLQPLLYARHGDVKFADVERPFLQSVREQIDSGSLTGGGGGQEQLAGAAFALLAGTFGGKPSALTLSTSLSTQTQHDELCSVFPSIYSVGFSLLLLQKVWPSDSVLVMHQNYDIIYLNYNYILHDTLPVIVYMQANSDDHHSISACYGIHQARTVRRLVCHQLLLAYKSYIIQAE